MKRILEIALEQDLGKIGDVTTNSLFRKDFRATAEIRVKDARLKAKSGVLAGMAELKNLAGSFGVKISVAKRDGSKIKFGERVCTLKGSVKELLKIERTALNLVCRMSGIATTVNWLSKKGVKIAATRKSPPGLMELDKKAVKIGGGLAHRVGLHGGILIKDNHIFALGKSEKLDKLDAIVEAVKRCKKMGPVEIEVSNQEEAMVACMAGADIVMLDNFTPAEAKRAVAKMRKIAQDVKIELSGGINEGNIGKYAKAGADWVSIGGLTNSARVIDMNMKIVKTNGVVPSELFPKSSRETRF